MELGKIQSLKIRHDNTGLGSAWFLDHVKVASPALDEPLAFPCKRWLATDEDDGQIERTLVPIPEKVFKIFLVPDIFVTNLKKLIYEVKTAI